jgi:hypothetical protein
MEGQEKPSKRLWIALSAYAILAMIAVFGLDGYFRGAVLLVLCILTVKTLRHAKDDEMG